MFTDKALKEDAFIAGLLHDIGKLLMAIELPDHTIGVVDAMRKDGHPMHVVEDQLHGISHAEVGAYLLAGLPDQTWESVMQSIQTVKQNGITPVIAYYTPIPHTELWPRAVATSRYDLEADPIFTNNAIFPCQTEAFSWEALAQLKQLTLS